MSVTHIPAKLRRAIRLRADNRCEYCGIHEDDTQFGCEVDHILSEKHLGQTEINNLALACFFCNRNKGSDIGSILSAENPEFIRFFNPRTDDWSDHFEFDTLGRIAAMTHIGQVTSRIFGFNTENRIFERLALQDR